MLGGKKEEKKKQQECSKTETTESGDALGRTPAMMRPCALGFPAHLQRGRGVGRLQQLRQQWQPRAWRLCAGQLIDEGIGGRRVRRRNLARRRPARLLGACRGAGENLAIVLWA